MYLFYSTDFYLFITIVQFVLDVDSFVVFSILDIVIIYTLGVFPSPEMTSGSVFHNLSRALTPLFMKTNSLIKPSLVKFGQFGQGPPILPTISYKYICDHSVANFG